MDSARWEHLQAIFHLVVDLPPVAQRTATRRCVSVEMTASQTQVRQLLEGDAQPAGAVDRGLADVAGDVFDTPVVALAGGGHARPVPDPRDDQGRRHGRRLLAERTDVGQRVAIKVLRDAWVSPSRRARFAIEQRTLARLNHRSIARLYDVDTLNEGTPFFVMEYVDGVPITEYCGGRASSVAERLALFRDDLRSRAARPPAPDRPSRSEAVEHPRHRGDGVVKLLDFGIAKEIEALGASADQTQPVSADDAAVRRPRAAAGRRGRRLHRRLRARRHPLRTARRAHCLRTGRPPALRIEPRWRSRTPRRPAGRPVGAVRRDIGVGRSRRAVRHRDARGHPPALLDGRCADPRRRSLS